VATLGLTMFTRWIPVHRAYVAAEAKAGWPAEFDFPAERAFPVSVVAGHGLLAVATVTLVLLTMLKADWPQPRGGAGPRAGVVPATASAGGAKRPRAGPSAPTGGQGQRGHGAPRDLASRRDVTDAPPAAVAYPDQPAAEDPGERGPGLVRKQARATPPTAVTRGPFGGAHRTGHIAGRTVHAFAGASCPGAGQGHEHHWGGTGV
jgi:hypothetical protein